MKHIISRWNGDKFPKANSVLLLLCPSVWHFSFGLMKKRLCFVVNSVPFRSCWLWCAIRNAKLLNENFGQTLFDRKMRQFHKKGGIQWHDRNNSDNKLSGSCGKIVTSTQRTLVCIMFVCHKQFHATNSHGLIKSAKLFAAWLQQGEHRQRHRTRRRKTVSIPEQ